MGKVHLFDELQLVLDLHRDGFRGSVWVTPGAAFFHHLTQIDHGFDALREKLGGVTVAEHV